MIYSTHTYVMELKLITITIAIASFRFINIKEESKTCTKRKRSNFKILKCLVIANLEVVELQNLITNVCRLKVLVRHVWLVGGSLIVIEV